MIGNKPKTRLYVDSPLQNGALLSLEDASAHYLIHTLRLREGAAVALFNAHDGEWRAVIEGVLKKSVQLRVDAMLRPQTAAPDIWLLFAPVKNEKIDYTVKRAVELGVSRLVPVMTRHTIVSRVNVERLRANAIEAAEQCGRMDIPPVEEPMPLAAALVDWPAERRLIFCDETGRGGSVRDVLPKLAQGPAAVLIGPEGGFAGEERQVISRMKQAVPLSLGPRILRAETAALTALAHVQAWLGDGQDKPCFQEEAV